jgi:hypothetical protein
MRVVGEPDTLTARRQSVGGARRWEGDGASQSIKNSALFSWPPRCLTVL